jgi:hypothetical protein
MKKSVITMVLLLLLSVTSNSWGWFPFKQLPSYNNVKERKQLANILSVEINAIYSAIPDLTPKEEDWLNKEMASENAVRKIRVLGSIEYIKKNTKREIKQIKMALDKIYSGQYKNKKEEMLWWLALIDCFMYSGMAYDLSNLVKTKTIAIDSENEYDNSDIMDIQGDLIAREILEKIITPYIQSGCLK